MTAMTPTTVTRPRRQRRRRNNAAAAISITESSRAAAVAAASLPLLLALQLLPMSVSGNSFCGSSWVDAVGSCARACPSGAPSDCSAGETCFANTPCVPAPAPTPPPVRAIQQQQQQQQQQQGPWGNPNSYTGPGNGATAGGTCGGGNRGDGRCPIAGECCSQYGHCGTTAAHCNNSANAVVAASGGTGGGTCGDGNRGDGNCPIAGECCSQYGHCGTSSAHCAAGSTTPVYGSPAANNNNANANANNGAFPPSTGGAAPSVYGTCGGGQVGNAICPNNSECCSQFGFCGTTPDHCNGKVGNLGPNYPQTGGNGNNGGLQQQNSNTPQFNQQGILVPGSSPSQQAQPQLAATPQVFGTCGGGGTGNGICPDNTECCSKHGFCGKTLEHCTNKVGPSMPGQPANSQQQQQTQTTYVVPQQNNGQQQQQNNVQQQGSDVPQYDARPATPQYDQQQQPGMYNPTVSTSGSNIQYGGGHLEPSVVPPRLPPSVVRPHGTQFKILGYYAGWQWYDRDKLAQPSNMDFAKVQRVNYAFFQPDVDGNIYGTDRWGDPQLLFGPYSSKLGGGVQRCSYDGPREVNCAYHEHQTGIIYQAHAQGAEVYPSIGGWTLSDNFPTLSANPVSRDNFAKKCVEILEHHDFDGIDIDWEYPGYADHSGTPADRENFTKMLAAIRAALEAHTRTTGKVYGLTAALPCNPDNIANIEVEKLTSILTEWNLMSYDFHGAWDAVTGVNAPLYPQGYGNEEFNIHRCVENYVGKGVARERINIGLPFYGRSFKNAKRLNQEHRGNDLANWPEDDGTPQYFNVYNKLPHMIQMRDNKSKTQYAYISHEEQPPGGLSQSLPEGLVSFDDERAICDKVHYAQEKNLGGFIIWELSGDMLDDLSTPLLDITNRKLGDPSLECCMLHSAEECKMEQLERDSATRAQMGGFEPARWGNQQQMSGSQQLTAGRSALILSTSLALVALNVNYFGREA